MRRALILIIFGIIAIAFFSKDEDKTKPVVASSESTVGAGPTSFREFTEKDFYWDKKTIPYKGLIITGVNKVHRENPRCKIIDPSSAYVSSSKGTKSNPVFYVGCGDGANSFNAFFSKSDIEQGKTLGAAHIDRTTAIDICESAAKSKAAHPSTVKFSRVMDLAVTEHPNGRTRVISSFTAKNSYNLELKYKITCLCDANGLIEASVFEVQ